MSKRNISLRFGLIVLMIVLAAASRFMPHPPNFTPIGAMGLFGAAYFTKKYWAFLIPLLALWFSDLILNNVVYAQYYDSFQWMGNVWVYLAFALVVVLGFGLLKKVSPKNLLGASLAASVIFFLITNFASWLMPISPYPATFSGLMACYTAGIPFFWNTLAGDLFFTAVLFGSFELVQYRFPQLALR